LNRKLEQGVELRLRRDSGRAIVAVIDDDESVRESLPDLLKTLGYIARAFASAEDFLESADIGETGCLILDITMPGMSGPDLLQSLKRHGYDIPTIFITAQKDETVSLGLSGQDFVACLFKPFSDTALLDALNAAFGDK
jgi:FixJ family two-component response regulator